MSRKILIKKFFPKQDFKYSSILVTLLINKILKKGKKQLAQKIVYKAFNYIFQQTNKNPLLIFEIALRNISPQIDLKTQKVKNIISKVPILLNYFTSINIALKWLIHLLKKKSSQKFYIRLGKEVLDASQNMGQLIKKKEELHKNTELHKLFNVNVEEEIIDQNQLISSEDNLEHY